jgi:hypothetical protein
LLKPSITPFDPATKRARCPAISDQLHYNIFVASLLAVTQTRADSGGGMALLMTGCIDDSNKKACQ